MKANEEKYKRALKELKDLQAPEDSWSIILSKINSDQDRLKSAIGDLKTLKAPEGAWEKISPKVNKASSAKSMTWLAVAASIVIIFTLYLFPENHNSDLSENVELATSLEINEADKLTNLINIECKKRHEICSDQHFLSIREEISELSNERSQLNELLKTFPNDHDYKKSFFKVERQMLSLQNELLQKLLES